VRMGTEMGPPSEDENTVVYNLFLYVSLRQYINLKCNYYNEISYTSRVCLTLGENY
jgi:hypothetical protein